MPGNFEALVTGPPGSVPVATPLVAPSAAASPLGVLGFLFIGGLIGLAVLQLVWRRSAHASASVTGSEVNAPAADVRERSSE